MVFGFIVKKKLSDLVFFRQLTLKCFAYVKKILKLTLLLCSDCLTLTILHLFQYSEGKFDVIFEVCSQGKKAYLLFPMVVLVSGRILFDLCFSLSHLVESFYKYHMTLIMNPH